MAVDDAEYPGSVLACHRPDAGSDGASPRPGKPSDGETAPKAAANRLGCWMVIRPAPSKTAGGAAPSCQLPATRGHPRHPGFWHRPGRPHHHRSLKPGSSRPLLLLPGPPPRNCPIGHGAMVRTSWLSLLGSGVGRVTGEAGARLWGMVRWGARRLNKRPRLGRRGLRGDVHQDAGNEIAAGRVRAR